MTFSIYKIKHNTSTMVRVTRVRQAELTNEFGMVNYSNYLENLD
jgi:hypothetical protein